MSQLEPPSKRKQLSLLFRNNFFKNITDEQWNDWKWQLKNRITTQSQLAKFFKLSDKEKVLNNLPLSITPYYASIMDLEDANDPLRKTMVPTTDELIKSEGEENDPLHESDQSPLATLVHRYPDRVLFLTTDQCSNYCRYCTRSRLVGKTKNINELLTWKANIEYIKNHTEIRDVLMSGGDPLMLNIEKLEWLLDELFKIKHIEMVRIGTKIPIVLPQRITEDLVKVLTKHQPLYISIHCTHPDELTEEACKALNMLADAGIPLGSQTVLLKDINDKPEIIKDLMKGLLKNRVRPYYLYDCDRIIGSSHFVSTLERGLEIIESLRGHMTGYGVPTFVVDAPGGGGKIPITPDYVKIVNKKYELRNWQGKVYYHS